MKIFITGICGFVGSTLASALLEHRPDAVIYGMDNFIRPGSEENRRFLQGRGVKLFHGDIRCASDFESLPAVDWVIDAAANPSVLAGVDGQTSSRQLIEHNLSGTVNILEYCKRHGAGFILLSTSRVYSITPLAEAEVTVSGEAFRLSEKQSLPAGLSPEGVAEHFSTAPPISL
jgi:CDP-paratose 2-epimerase